MKKMLVITVTGDHKYSIGNEKSVGEVIQEINNSYSDYYMPVDTCAIKISEIVSIEQFEYDPEGQEKK